MTRSYGYLLLAVTLLLLLSVPNPLADKMRYAAVGPMTSPWRHMGHLKDLVLKLTTIWPSGGYRTHPDVIKELEMIRLENYHLHSQIGLLRAELQLKQTICEQSQLLTQISEQDGYAQRRKEELLKQMELYSHAITARVIFRESGAWKSSLWINVGKETNRRLQTRLVEKNSPIVLGTTVVGVIDFVGEKQSRVRLLTDSALSVSVRVIRPLKQGRSLYLAKGEISGASSMLWRSRGTLLRGEGFNYEFADAEGSKEDNRIIQERDMIITTGMDGLFPPGLRIGVVTKLYPLKEGASCYQADISSFIETFDDLFFVTVLPALEF